MDGAKALKGWLAAMLRQLSLIVQRNPAVFKSKTKLIRLGLDPANGNRGSGVDCLVELSAEGVLTIVQNMESAAKPDPTVSQRVDGVLDVTMANLQSEVSSEMTMRSQALSNALRIPGLAVNLDFSFESDPVFYALPPQSKAAKIKRLRGHVESTLDALIKCGPEACVGLVAVLVCCDGSNETRDVFTGATDADHYLTVLDRDGLLRVTLNLESVEKSLGRLHHKIEQQLALHRARQDTTYHAGPEFFDWESLQSCGLLLNDSILVAFEASISHCKESVRAFARAVHKSRSETPAGRDALARIQTLRVCMEREQQDLWRTRLHDESTLVLSLSLQFVKDKSRIEELDWKESLEWTLHYATVEVEKFHAEKCKAAAEAALSKAFGAPLQIRIDWPVYIDRPEFKDLGASGCRAAIRELSTELLNSIVHGVSAIAQHPVGAKALKEKVKNITISYGPNVDVAQRLMEPCKVSLLPGSELLISFRNLHDSVSVNYKSRVEFELGIVVAVAEFDATARREAVSKALGGHPLNYSLDSFQKSDEYRFGVAIADQPAIVDAVVAGVAEHVFASQSDGLVAVWSRAKAVVKSTLVELSVNRSLTTTFGRLELRAGGVLALTLDLGSVLQVKNSRNWRSRIASVCGFLDDLSKEECNEKLSKTSQKLSLSPVVIEWTEVFAALKHLPAADRYERAHNLGGELARDVLLGYWGLEGLASFPKIKSELQSRVKQISLTIAAGSGGGTYKTEMQGTTLRIVFPLDETREWNKSNKQGCRERVEALLSLRPMVEAEAIEEQEHAHVQPTAVQISKKVLVDWQKLLGSADYRAVRDYVAYIRYVGSFIPKCLVGYGDKPEGLHWMLATNAQAKEFFTTISTIEIVIDGDCKEKPAQERFVNARMSCVKKAPSSIVLTVRRDWMETDEDDNGWETPHRNQIHQGCGTVVGACLAPAVFASDEANHLEQYRAQLVENEEDRRQDTMRRWQRECESNTEEYNRDMQAYARAGTEKCSSCQGKGHWGKNFTTCSTCKGTRFKQAAMRCPSMPVNPPQPMFNALSTINFKGIAESETRFKQCAKLAFEPADESVPSAPKFSERPCAKWSANKATSLGAEDAAPAGWAAAAVGGWSDYTPTELRENPWSEREMRAVAAKPSSSQNKGAKLAKAPAKK